MKIVSSGKVLNSREFYEKKKRRKRVKLTLFIIGFLLLITILAYFSRQEQFLIAGVNISEESVIDKDAIILEVENFLDGYYFWIIPRANTFIYPRRTIEETLLVKFPKFKSVDLDVTDQTLSISVDERAPFALYCISECYFLDEEGLIFALAPSFSGGVYLVYTTENPIENPLGKRLETVEEFKRLSKFIETLAVLNIYPVALEIRAREYGLFLPNGGQIIWRKEADLNLIRSNLEAFLSNDSIKAQGNFLDKVRSLDLRTEDKVFYKFRD